MYANLTTFYKLALNKNKIFPFKSCAKTVKIKTEHTLSMVEIV